METPLIEAIASHYLEQYPHLIRRGNILFFQREGAILSLEPDEAVLATGILDPELKEMVTRILATTPTENLEKINQIRGWKYLFKRVKWHRIDYGDPILFQLTDAALHG